MVAGELTTIEANMAVTLIGKDHWHIMQDNATTETIIAVDAV